MKQKLLEIKSLPIYLALLYHAMFIGCSNKQNFIESLMLHSGKFDEAIKNAEKHRLQIIYTQIDRDSSNQASFRTYNYRLNNNYFYPASTIKLPITALALEKVNDLSIEGFTPHSIMQVDSAYSGQVRVHQDTSSENGYPSIANYIKKIFLLSDNDAFNRLYEFLGQEEANKRLISKGYCDVRITHRVSSPLSPEENRHTNPVRFYEGDSLIFKQEAKHNDHEIKSDYRIQIGKGYIKNGHLIEGPMDFSYKNAISLKSLHDILLSLIFPKNFSSEKRFNLNPRDYQFLHEHMSKYPRESVSPKYGNTFKDSFCKFLMFGGTEENIDSNIRIFNKIGAAYGFLIDIAYIVDFNKNIEFVLGAVIYVNENEILNDNQYEYESIGYPFMRDLGQLFYDYEVKRVRAFEPDLSKYNWKLWTE